LGFFFCVKKFLPKSFFGENVNQTFVNIRKIKRQEKTISFNFDMQESFSITYNKE